MFCSEQNLMRVSDRIFKTFFHHGTDSNVLQGLLTYRWIKTSVWDLKVKV
jgi:hypothetical protein